MQSLRSKLGSKSRNLVLKKYATRADTFIITLSWRIYMLKDGTYHPVELTPAQHSKGYYMALAGYECQTRNRDAYFERILLEYYKDKATALGAYLRIWTSEGRTYYDISLLVLDRDAAIALGKQEGQEAIWDIAARASIYLNEK